MRGDGGLEERIDRILRDDTLRPVSPMRKAIVAVACALATVAIPACRQASAAKVETSHALIPDVLALIYSKGIPFDPEFRRRLQGVRATLGQSNDVGLLVSNGLALVNRFDPYFNAGGEASETGRDAISRALKLDPGRWMPARHKSRQRQVC